MKKITKIALAVLLAVSMLLTVAACSGSGSSGGILGSSGNGSGNSSGSGSSGSGQSPAPKSSSTGSTSTPAPKPTPSPELETVLESKAKVIAVFTSESYLVGLRDDGTVVATSISAQGDSSLPGINEWTDIVGVHAVVSQGVFGIKKDGTVVRTGNPRFIENTAELDNWTDIVAITGGSSSNLLGLKSDGTLVTTFNNPDPGIYELRNIVAISGAGSEYFTLKDDGTVYFFHIQQPPEVVDGWANIIAISGSGNTVFGIRADGTVVLPTGNEYSVARHAVSASRQEVLEEVKEWRDIIAVASTHTGLRSDGTVVTTLVDGGIQEELETWIDVVAISAAHHLVVGVQSDGTVLVHFLAFRERTQPLRDYVSNW